MFNRFVRPFCVSLVVLIQACGSSTGSSSSNGGTSSAGSGGAGHGAGASSTGSAGTGHGAGASSTGNGGSGQSAGASNGGNANTAGASNSSGGDVDAGLPPCPDGQVRIGDSTECTAAKRIFITKSRYTGDLVSQASGATDGLDAGAIDAGAKDGLDAADALCNSSAQKAGLSGQYRAWLSSSTVNAIDRLTDVGPWYLLNDYSTPLFENKAAIPAPDAGAYAFIYTTEDGSSVGLTDGSPIVWTGTAPDGTNHNAQAAAPNQFCMDWTSAKMTDGGTYGFDNRSVSDPTWTQYPNVTGPCSVLAHLYCFEQ